MRRIDWRYSRNKFHPLIPWHLVKPVGIHFLPSSGVILAYMSSPCMHEIVADNCSGTFILVTLRGKAFRARIERAAEGRVVWVEFEDSISGGRGYSWEGSIEEVIIEVFISIDEVSGAEEGRSSFVLYFRDQLWLVDQSS